MNSNLSTFILITSLSCLPTVFVSQANALNDSDSRVLENSFVKANPKLVFGDGFESGCWRAEVISSGINPGACEDDSSGELWYQSQMQSDSSARVVDSSSWVRMGEHALKLSWRKDRVKIDENGVYDTTSMKSMLDAPRSETAMGTDRWYGFSVFLPAAGFRPEPNGHFFFQLEASPDQDLEEASRQPIFSLSYNHETRGFKGRYSYDTRKVSPGNKNIEKNATSFEIKRPNKRNYLDRWVDFVVHVVIDWKGEGLVEVWLDGNRVYEARDVAIGYNDEAGPYASFGLYYYTSAPYNHNHWMFLDEVRIGGAEASFEDVVPGRRRE